MRSVERICESLLQVWYIVIMAFLLQAVSGFLQIGYSLTTSGEGGYGKCHSCRDQSGDKSPG
jgi:hypothetical protein